MKTSPSDREILGFMMAFARLYLNSGGPTSRLEDNLIRIGALYGRETEVFATPTGVFVTLNDPRTTDDPTTALARIRETGTNLGQLVELEKILRALFAQEIPLPQAASALAVAMVAPPIYSKQYTAAAAFVAGMVASYMTYQKPVAAAVSGAITAFAWFVINHVLRRQVSNPIFSDFAGAFLTLVCAAIAHAFVAPLAMEAYAIGGIMLLVPGLALTTAIAELAEQNLVSGTAKFMQATLALLALGLAYLLFQQIAYSLELRGVLQPVAAKHSTFFVSVFGVILNIACFGVLFKVPLRALLWSTLTGLAGWVALEALLHTSAAAGGPYLAAVVVGVVSLALGRVFRLPSQVFSVPGIVGMLPGMLALSSFRYFASGDQDTGIAFTFQVAVTAVSIVFGLMTARVPFVVGDRYSVRIWERWKKVAKTR
ncbi:MAG TPA: threonine/serine exporter family protein [Bdellovibrionota bacterium]|jgi:uncharacterized membrane protein YjjP (DUF1212 family)